MPTGFTQDLPPPDFSPPALLDFVPPAETEPPTTPAEPELPSTVFARAWSPIGPGPTRSGQVIIPPNNEICGAIQAIAAHPTNASILYIGSVGGGIWRTVNATAASPAWTPLTDSLASLNIGALEFDAMDGTFQTLVAGSARLSSFGAVGGSRIGVLRTTDGGNNWTVLGGSFANENLLSVAARGSIIMAASDTQWGGGSGSGLFRSTNTGGSFTLVSGTSGLSAGPVSDLVADPIVPARFYAAVRTVGIFRSDDSGATWTNVTAGITGISATTVKIEMAVHNNGATNAVYVGIIGSGNTLASVWRSTTLGASWTQMDTPATHNGPQGQIHFSIAADRNNANLVYIGGDRITSSPFTGNLFRGNASLALGSQLTTIMDGNANSGSGNTTPHADSREMVMDANGNLIQGDDGGLYRRSSPTLSTGTWSSVIGNLACFETHDVAYDSVANVGMVGTQDNGTHIQSAGNSTIWTFINGGDGGDVAIDDTSTPGQSVRYGSSQNLGGFFRKTYNASNGLLSTVFPARTVLSGGPAITVQFVTPIALNKVNPVRLIIGGSNAAYESLNRGDSVTALTPISGVNGTFTGLPIAYGGYLAGVPNVDILYYGSGSTVKVRTTTGGSVANTAAAFPGGTVQDIVLDSNDWQRVFVASSSSIYVSTNVGASWTNITGDLTGVGAIHTIEFFKLNGADCVAAGTDIGVFCSFTTSLGTWSRLGTGLPNVVVYDMQYNATDKVLVIGTMGRSTFRLDVGTPTLTTGPNINISKASGNNTEEAIAINPTNPNNLIASETFNDVTKFSLDGGLTWTNSNLTALPASLGDVAVAWDRFGNCFLTRFGPSQTIVVGLSTNGGATFGTLFQTASINNDQPSVSTGPGTPGPGSVWITYTNSASQIVVQGASVAGLGSVGAFGADQIAPGAGGDFGDIAVGPTGQVLVTYQDNNTTIGPESIRLNLDADGLLGGSLGSTTVPTTTNVGGFAPIPANPDRTIDAESGLAWDRTGGPRNGRTYLVYTDRASTATPDTDIYVRFSNNNGATWSAPVRVNDDPLGNGKSQFMPRIALDQTTGNIAVSFYDCRNSAANNTVQLWATVSTDGGLTFLPNLQVSTGTSDGTVAALGSFDLGNYTGLTYHNGVFYPCWADNSNSTGDNPNGALANTDIYTARVTVATDGLELLTAASVKTHGGTGVFEIPLPISGPGGVECRLGNGGVSGNHTLVFDFNRPVVSGSAAVSAGTGSVSGAPTFSGNRMTVGLTGVADMQNIAITLSPITASNGAVLLAVTVPMGLLRGDANGTRSVNVSDVNLVKAAASPGTVDATNFRRDVNAGGSINVSDVNITKAASGNSIP